jgi:hypothetical protein
VIEVEDLNLDDVPHLGARQVLAFARTLGVRVVDLDSIDYDPEFGINYDETAQRWMQQNFGAGRCPDGDHGGVYLYASYGMPKKGKRGTLFVPGHVEDEEEWDQAFSYTPEVILLHEIAHTVVGSEKNTSIWETEAVRALFGESDLPDSVWQEMQQYQDGAERYDPWEGAQAYRRLRAWGHIPVLHPRIRNEQSIQLNLAFQ